MHKPWIVSGLLIDLDPAIQWRRKVVRDIKRELTAACARARRRDPLKPWWARQGLNL
ncbi:hypothetical protein WCLP8_5220018 [uncultured Gammaproteobacteria bacterium]